MSGELSVVDISGRICTHKGLFPTVDTATPPVAADDVDTKTHIMLTRYANNLFDIACQRLRISRPEVLDLLRIQLITNVSFMEAASRSEFHVRQEELIIVFMKQLDIFLRQNIQDIFLLSLCIENETCWYWSHFPIDQVHRELVQKMHKTNWKNSFLRKWPKPSSASR